MREMSFPLYREFFRALGNSTRFGIVQLLRAQPRHVGQIAADLGYEQSRISHSLACLLHCGFVLWEWEGKNKVYRLHPQLAPILAAIDNHLQRYASRLAGCQVLGEEKRQASPIVVLASGREREGRPARSRRRIRRQA